jgi:enoyl-CoA hydratase
MSHALDLILTGRGVSGDEAVQMGLANRIVDPGSALPAAVELGKQLAAFPQGCLRADRLSVYEQCSMPVAAALDMEVQRGMEVIRSGETREGAARFAEGAGRHGSLDG